MSMKEGAHFRFHKLCSLPNNIKVLKSRRFRWVEDVARMGKMRDALKILVKDLLGNLGVDGRIILKFCSKKESTRRVLAGTI
jgi:hypothetical protein